MEQSATEQQTFSQLKKQEDTAIPRRHEVNILAYRRISKTLKGDFLNLGNMCAYMDVGMIHIYHRFWNGSSKYSQHNSLVHPRPVKVLLLRLRLLLIMSNITESILTHTVISK